MSYDQAFLTASWRELQDSSTITLVNAGRRAWLEGYARAPPTYGQRENRRVHPRRAQARLRRVRLGIEAARASARPPAAALHAPAAGHRPRRARQPRDRAGPAGPRRVRPAARHDAVLDAAIRAADHRTDGPPDD